MAPRSFKLHESCSCWLVVKQCKCNAAAEGCFDWKVMHTDILVKVLWRVMNKGRRGMLLSTYLHSDFSCSRSDSGKHPAVAVSRGELGTESILCCIPFFKRLFSAAPRSRILLCSHLKTLKKRVNKFLHSRVLAKLERIFWCHTDYFSMSSLELWHWITRWRQVPKV